MPTNSTGYSNEEETAYQTPRDDESKQDQNFPIGALATDTHAT